MARLVGITMVPKQVMVAGIKDPQLQHFIFIPHLVKFYFYFSFFQHLFLSILPEAFSHKAGTLFVVILFIFLSKIQRDWLMFITIFCFMNIFVHMKIQFAKVLSIFSSSDFIYLLCLSIFVLIDFTFLRVFTPFY